MKVRELIAELYKCNLDDLVVVSRDDRATPLDGISEELYEAWSRWAGEVGIKELTPDLREQGYTEEDLGHGEDCVVLWPTH
jgi:hypothetical protein